MSELFGIVVLDKPSGMSSNRALQKLKRLFGVKKAGHGGCLDPLATGVLPLYLGQATKFSMYSLGAEKGYQVEAKLGVTTTTGDVEGEIVSEHPIPPLTESDVLKAVESLTGEIQQIPPMFSALKRDGQPLYRLARQGITVEREPRTVQIMQFRLLSFELPYLRFDVLCSKGTYIRTLMEDLGKKLGCGATMTALRRTKSGVFSLDQSVTLEQCEHLKESGSLSTVLNPCEEVLKHIPRQDISLEQGRLLLQGKRLLLDHQNHPGELCCLYADSTYFLGLGEYREDNELAAKRLLHSVLELS